MPRRWPRWRRAPPRSATDNAGELVWLLEHPPLFTAGTSSDPTELFNPEGFDVFDAGRGGRYTYHGPGQRVGYLVLDLDKRGRDIRRFVHRARRQWMIDALAELGVAAHRAPGRIGIWVGDGDSGGQDRCTGRTREALGHAARLFAQCRPGFGTFHRHRSVRNQRIWCHQPAKFGETNVDVAG